MISHEIQGKRGMMVLFFLLGIGLFFSSSFSLGTDTVPLTQEQVEQTRLTWQRGRSAMKDSRMKSPIMRFFKVFADYCQQFTEDSLCTQYQDRHFNEFVLNGTPMQDLLDLSSQLVLLCMQDHDLIFCQSDPFIPYPLDFPSLENEIHILEQDQDLISFTQDQDYYCEHPSSQDCEDHCRNFYPLDDQPISIFSDEEM